MRESYLRGGQGFLIVFSVTNRYSFETVPALHEHILRVKEAKSFPVVIAANKIDLVDERDVTHSEARDLAKKLGCPCLEVSARTRTNVEECFCSLVREIRKSNPDSPQQRRAEEPYRRKERRLLCSIL
jgi:GTPase KRas protein